jgi:hypothetical protein
MIWASCAGNHLVDFLDNVASAVKFTSNTGPPPKKYCSFKVLHSHCLLLCDESSRKSSQVTVTVGILHIVCVITHLKLVFSPTNLAELALTNWYVFLSLSKSCGRMPPSMYRSLWGLPSRGAHEQNPRSWSSQAVLFKSYNSININKLCKESAQGSGPHFHEPTFFFYELIVHLIYRNQTGQRRKNRSPKLLVAATVGASGFGAPATVHLAPSTGSIESMVADSAPFCSI